jgi:hypothetical protein
MNILDASVFITSGLYAIFGNLAVGLILRSRNIPLPGWRSRMPFVLYKVCVHASPRVGPALRRFAFSTNIAGSVFILAALPLMFQPK